MPPNGIDAAPSTPADPRPGLLERLGRWCARHAWPVVAVALVVLAGVTVTNQLTGGGYTDDFTISNTESAQGTALLEQHDVIRSGDSSWIVFHVESGSLSSHRSAIEQSVSNVGDVDHVITASDPLTQATTSSNGRVAYSTVQFDGNPGSFGPDYVDDVDDATRPATSAGVAVDYTGNLGQAADPSADDRQSELIGIGVAVLVLLAAFGSVLAAGLPILSSALGVVIGLGILGLLATQITFATTAPTIAVMIGLGVGIDYALFITTRYRQLVMDGADPNEAAGRTIATSGRSVLIAACTVVVALLGLYTVGISFIGKLGLAAAIAVAVAVTTAITVAPALLGLLGRRIDRWRIRTPVAEHSADATSDSWRRYADLLSRHPWRFLSAGVLVAGLLAIPAFSMDLGHIDDGASATGTTSRSAYDAIASGFGVGTNGQFTVVVQPSTSSTSSQTHNLSTDVHRALENASGVASATPAAPSQDGAILVSTVTPTSSPQSQATDDLLNRLRDDTLPDVLSGTGATSYVTGATAAALDFRDIVADRLPAIIAVVVAAAFILLLITFRSPVLALKAAVLNLLSITASYGVIVAVFQWGWGEGILGLDETVPIESYVPMIMFAIVFGLSMDYEVFLLSRIREAWLETGDSRASVVTGLSVTARVISSAALIMMSVFFAFLTTDVAVIKILALGLGVSVLIDATIIRLLVVPSAMFILGRGCWWLPGWLDRLLPHFDPESAPTPPAPRHPALG